MNLEQRFCGHCQRTTCVRVWTNFGTAYAQCGECRHVWPVLEVLPIASQLSSTHEEPHD